VSARPFTRTAYSEFTVALKDPRNLRQVLRDLSNVRERVVVNLIDADGRTSALSADTLHQALAHRPSTLVVQALPPALYRSVMCGKVARVTEQGSCLRLLLRDKFLPELDGELTAFLQHLDQLLFLLHGYALQDWRPRITRLVKTLSELGGQLTRSARIQTDPVCCMDDLHYEIVPTLNALAEIFQPIKARTSNPLSEAA
jgi:hypothetical protein